MTNTDHNTEADCAGLLADDDCCTVCGVSHASPCPDCGARGYHLTTCLEMAPRPLCIRCAMPFDHGCNSAYCSEACEIAAEDDGPVCEHCGKRADEMTTTAFAPFCSLQCAIDAVPA